MTRPTFEERFWSRVAKGAPGECWQWLGGLSTEGYGHISRDGRQLYVHRVSYEMHVGPIPDKYVIDHLCRNRPCLNPEHLEAVTHQVNILRGVAPTAVAAVANRCKRGHDLSVHGWVRTDGRGRNCLECQRVTRAEARLIEPRRRRRPAERVAEAKAALAGGACLAEACAEIGVTPNGLRRACRTVGRLDIYDALTARKASCLCAESEVA